MTRIDINELPTDLLARLGQNAGPETLELTQNGVVIGHVQYLGKLDSRPGSPRPAGLAKGLVEVPKSFFDPLPDDLLKAFSEEGE